MSISDFNRFGLSLPLSLLLAFEALLESEQATNIKVKTARILTNFKSIDFSYVYPYSVIYFENDDIHRLN